jgi:hypothetical protein
VTAGEVWDAGQAGDFRGIDHALCRLAEANDADGRAWEIALRALRWHAQPDHGSLPALDDVAAFREAGHTARSAAALACSQVERAAVLALDVDALARWSALHAELLRGGEGLDAHLAELAARTWLALLTGDLTAVEPAAERLESDAGKARLSAMVVEAATLRAIAAMARGDLEGALATARRASRMARTEALPQAEYLAHIALARMRRLTQRPHLAVRILAALARAAPRPWAGWLAWELRLAGDEQTSAALDGPPPDHGPSGVTEHALPAAAALRHAIEAASAADRAAFERELAIAAARCGTIPWRAVELAAARIALDPDADTAHADARLDAWLRGGTSTPPPVLAGLCTVADATAASESAAAYVLAQPPRAARRVLVLGLPLAGEEARRVQKVKRKKGRTDTALAVLALAGAAGLSREDLFKEVYGFNYTPVLHQSVLDVLLHRLRGVVEGSGEIDRGGERIVLRLREPLVVPDPRCTSSVDGQVLRLLATQTVGTAKEAAEALGVSLRAAQAALQQLVNDGALISERKGNQVAYRVEDTTFSEPTKH